MLIFSWIEVFSYWEVAREGEVCFGLIENLKGKYAFGFVRDSNELLNSEEFRQIADKLDELNKGK